MNLKRRDFLKAAAGLAVGGVSFAPSEILADVDPKSKHRDPGYSSRVVIVRRPGLISLGQPAPSQAVSEMIGEGICRLTGRSTAAKAWTQLFKPGDRIGIKINAVGAPDICTHPRLAYGVAEHLMKAGIPPGNIIIWDRLTDEMLRGGYAYRNNTGAVRCTGTDNRYEPEPEISGSIGSCFSRILTRQCDALICIPVLKDHNLSGVSLSMKNFYGAIHNPNKYHGNGCDPFIADLVAHPHIRQKLRLVITDGLISQCNGGPAFSPRWARSCDSLIFSCDPVAADRIGASLIEKQRRALGLPSLKDAGRPPVHIDTAAQKGLGISDPGRIEKITI